jgi:hypothetical protein
MTDTVQDLVAQVRQSTDYQINKRILKEKILTDLHMTYNNGMFLVTPEILSFVATWPNEKLFLEDTYENPIEIDREEFLYRARQHYQTAMNSWHQQYEELKKIRKI